MTQPSQMEKTSRHYVTHVKTHVESAVQDHGHRQQAWWRQIDVDADVSCVKTLQLRIWSEVYEFYLFWHQLKTPCCTPTVNMRVSSSWHHVPNDFSEICVSSAYKWWDIGLMTSLTPSVYAVNWEGPCGTSHINLVGTDDGPTCIDLES